MRFPDKVIGAKGEECLCAGSIDIDMCGIFGIVTRQGESEVAQILARAGVSLVHRGPDDAGQVVFRDEARGLTIGLAHQRLAILDLSVAGHQPMVDEVTGNRIVYNGEVFNFREERRRLEGAGVQFHSGTDTEVVLKSYGRGGADWEQAIRPWRGMFAFGLWRAAEGALHLVRDRLGIKPVYYYQGKDFLVFGSEVRTLLASGMVPPRLSRVAVESFLSYGSIEDPLAIIEGVRAVLPGHRLVYRDQRVEMVPYWEIRVGSGDERPEEPGQEELVEEVRQLTREAVRLWTIADVPVSLFLSGGIDSSALLSLAGQVGASEIRTFAVGFREAEFDEQGYAEMVARHYGAEHTTIQLTEAEVLMKLPAALRALDQPSIDGLNTWIVAEATRSAGMKVALSGLGGDEAFLGYRLFQTIERDERRRGWLERVPGPLRELAGELIGRLARNHGSTRLSELVRNGQVNIPTARLRRELFSPRQRMELLAEWPEGNEPEGNEPEGNEMEGAARQELQEWLRRQIRNCAGADPINRAAAFELGGYLSNTLLRDTDVMSMAHGLEVRVPLLDHPLLERLLQIDGATRLGRGARSAKWLLVEAAGDLPHAVTSRRKKGFELPFAPWLRGPLRGLVEEALSSTALAGVIDRAAGLRIWNDFLVGRTSWSRVWALVVLSRWIELHPEQKV